MTKRGLLLAVMGLFLLVSSFSVKGAFLDNFESGGGAASVITTLGKFLFEDLPNSNFYGVRFLLWIILFALFFYGLTQAFGTGGERKYAGVIAFAASLLVSIVIPGPTIEAISSLYGGIIILLLALILPISVLFIVFFKIRGNTVGYTILKIFIISLALVAFYWFKSNTAVLFGGLP